MSLRPFRWCRCAYKVAAPRVPCFRPCSWPLVSLAAVLACWCPCVYIPVQYIPHQSQRGLISRHTGAPCVYWWPPRFVCACGGLAGGVWWLLRRVRYWRRYYYAAIPRGPLVAGNCAPPCLPCQYVKKLVPLAGGLCTAPAVLAVSLRGVICARAGYRAPPWVTLHGLTLCGIIPRVNRR